MCMVVCALIAISGEPALPNPAIHYCQLGRGWLLSKYIRPGMDISE